MALALGCVWEHVPAYVRVVQVVQGAPVPVRVTVIRHVPMHVLPGVRNRQAPVVAVLVQVCVVGGAVETVPLGVQVVTEVAVQGVQQVAEVVVGVTVQVLALITAIPPVVRAVLWAVQVAEINVLRHVAQVVRVALAPAKAVVTQGVVMVVPMFVKELAENPLVQEETGVLVRAATVHLLAKEVAVMLARAVVVHVLEAVAVMTAQVVVAGIVQAAVVAVPEGVQVVAIVHVEKIVVIHVPEIVMQVALEVVERGVLVAVVAV